MIKTPYLLFLGDAPDHLAVKVAQGIKDWRPENCVGQFRLEGCKADLKIPDMTLAEAKAAGALKENAAIRIPLTLMDNAEGGLVRVEAIAYFCEDDGPCQVSGVLFEVPVALAQAPGKPVELKHTFSSQAAQFGLPIGETP